MALVLICSRDPELSGLLTLNLERRGFAVQRESWSPCCEWTRDGQRDADLVIADLDCPEPGCWDAAARLRARFNHQPLIFLGYPWAAGSRLQRVQPCRYVRKPFGIEELLRALQVYAPMSTTT